MRETTGESLGERMEETMAKVAFVGLGVMGYPMAGHLRAKGGHDVTVYNRTAAKAEKWVAQHGGKSAPTPKQAAEGQDFVMACVGNDNDLREVMLGKDGIFAGAQKGAVVVDHTTASAAIARDLHAEAKKRGFEFVDAPVSAPAWPPETGASTKSKPRLLASAYSSRAISADAVVWSTTIAPLAVPAKTPSLPSMTSRRSWSLPTQAMMKSCPSAACFGVGALLPPCWATHFSALAEVRL